MDNLTDRQRELLGALGTVDPAAAVEWDEARGVASSIRGTLARGAPREAAATVTQFLATFGPLFGPPDLGESLRLLRSRGDDLGWTHLEFQQELRTVGRGKGRGKPEGLELYGAKLVAHVTAEGVLRQVESGCWRDARLEGRARVTARALRSILVDAAAPVPGYREMEARTKRRRRRTAFPIAQPPRLVVYFWQDRFRLAWTTYAWGPAPVAAPRRGRPAVELVLGQVFVDAVSGERFLFSPTGLSAEVHVAGTGRGVTRDTGGAFVVRSLNVVQVNNTATHRLRDTTHNRDIITYDLAVDPLLATVDQMGEALLAGQLPVSESTAGPAWNTVANPPAVSRASSQQPEVDAHFLVCQAYEWYDALSGGRDGWDGGGYPPATVPANLPVRVVTHVFPFWQVNASFYPYIVDGLWIPFLQLWDCDPDQQCAVVGDRGVDYMAGSRNVVGHEYQHGITAFSFMDGGFSPGLGTAGWARSVAEGLSDVFGCLFSDQWTWGPEIAPVPSPGPPLVLRNAAFPRDVTSWENMLSPGLGSGPCGWEHANKDHFDDRAADPIHAGEDYDNGTILAHCAFLMAAGGIHQRAGRAPALIPVRALGRETLGGLDFSRAARIWYRALTQKMQAYVTATGKPNLDEEMFRKLRKGSVESAEEIFTAGSVEEKTTALAFYAVGLHPETQAYGADVTCVPWAAAWWRSRPYLPGMYGACPDWASVDLFVNNDGVTSEWNALVNVVDTASQPTHFENSVYCRVRNVGDRPAGTISVQFFYARLGTLPVTWLPVADQSGVAQTLHIAGLAAGGATFDDASQGAPPAAAGVKWDIPPLASGETVDHFCLRATLTCAGNANPADDDVNPFNNDVQSNIAYAAYAPGQALRLRFVIGNPFARPLAARLLVVSELPEGWEARLADHEDGLVLEPREERTVELRISMAAGADARLVPPLDGIVDGELSGPLAGRCRGALTGTVWDGARLTGTLALQLGDAGYVHGDFDGRVDTATGALSGRATAVFQNAATGASARVGVGIGGQLRPWRRVHVTQAGDGRPLGGFTLQIQGATPGQLDAPSRPGTATAVKAPGR